MTIARSIKGLLPQFCVALTLIIAVFCTRLLAEPLDHTGSHQHSHSHAVNGSQKVALNYGLSQSGVRFTCPMHPEVVSETPGRCPHCGMKLVEQELTPRHGRRR